MLYRKLAVKNMNTFTTNSKNVVTVKDAEEGTVTLPLQLDAEIILSKK